MEQRRLVIGLGNPGAKYEMTRHNAGFEVVSSLAGELGWAWNKSLARDALVAKGTFKGVSLTLLQPLLYMNCSGPVVSKYRKKLSLPAEGLLVVSDDLDLPLGKVRLRSGGSSGGHNGLKSIQDALGTQEYPRLRLGIGRGENTEEYVLERFHSEEISLFREEVALAKQIVKIWLIEGIEAAMRESGRSPPKDNSAIGEKQ